MTAMSAQDRILEEYLDRAVDEFDTNGVARVFLRRLSYESPAQFLPAAMRHLCSNYSSNAHRFLAMLALHHEEVIGYLTNPAVATGEIAEKLFKRFLEVDPSFDVKLARMLPDRSYANHAVALDGARAIRALDILDRQSQGRRLLPILGHLPGAEDSKVAAKATLFVGRRVQSPDWVAKALARPDQRVRANALESMWGVNLPAAVEILEKCADDRSNRVLGNALVGLHIVGHRSIDSELMALSKTASADRRSTAAWAMGRVANGQWTGELTRMVKDDHPLVRSMAIRSLLAMRRTENVNPEIAVARMAKAAPEVKEEAIRLASQVVGVVSPASMQLKGASVRMRK
jgi:HEAT repeat protein